MPINISAFADVHLLVGLAVAVAFSITLSTLSCFRGGLNLCLISVIGAAMYHWQAFAGFLVVNAIGYAVIRWLDLQTDRSARWSRAGVALFVLIIVFTVGRIRHWEHLSVLPSPVPIALYSLDMWLVLRLATLFWEVGSGSMKAPPFIAYITWTCLPLTLGGPLVRYSQFPTLVLVNRSVWKSPEWLLGVALGSLKLVAGLTLAFAQQIMLKRWPQAHLLNSGATTLITGPLGFYLINAGYFHLLEALGRPAGFKLPESFNYPIGRENLSAFWMNWNMTATAVFRDYLFYTRWGLRTHHLYLNSLLLFTLVGLWHAANAYWILWGFLHGLLFCGYLTWRKFRNRLGNIPLGGTSTARMAARTLTYVSVCAAWYLPSKILQKLGAVGI